MFWINLFEHAEDYRVERYEVLRTSWRGRDLA